MTKNVPELFGSMVFNDEVMKERLPKDIYKALQKPSQMACIYNWMWQMSLPQP